MQSFKNNLLLGLFKNVQMQGPSFDWLTLRQAQGDTKNVMVSLSNHEGSMQTPSPPFE
jgi:hypothetical protein